MNGDTLHSTETLSGGSKERHDSSPFVFVNSNDLNTISSSDSGGGSPGCGDGAVPGASANSTPPNLPHKGAAHHGSKSLCSESSPNTARSFIGFSPLTCLELLTNGKLSPEQLRREHVHFNRLGYKGLPNLRTSRSKKFPENIVNEFKKILTSQILTDYSELMSDYDTLTSSISYLAERAQSAARNVEPPVNKALKTGSTGDAPVEETDAGDETSFFSSDDTLRDTSSFVDKETEYEVTSHSPERDSGTPSTQFSDSVCCLLDLKFNDLAVDSITSDIKFESAHKGGRKTAYYGPHPYSYGKTKHPAAPYPYCPLFLNLFSKLQSAIGPEFTQANYSCLVTLYENGNVGIPPHSDNELEIVPGSKIYTVSVGAERTLRFVNNTGSLAETDVTIPDGSVYSMDADSQSVWRHSLVVDRSVTAPRVSFTFRHMLDPGTTQRPIPSPVPPIKPPEPVKPRIAVGTHKRLLFLTDSVLKDTPEFIFNRIGGGTYRCVKKVNYELNNVFNFEPEFTYTDVVVISCGVNDLSRYGRRSEVLADLVTRRLKKTCAKHKNTTFVFTSLLSTSFGWLALCSSWPRLYPTSGFLTLIRCL